MNYSYLSHLSCPKCGAEYSAETIQQKRFSSFARADRLCW